MFSYYLQGLALGAAMILPLGPQNAFVMNQGIRRQYHIMIALLCAISDLVLICAGIFGGSALLMQSPWLLALVTWGGVVFLLWYGFGAFKTAMSSNIELASAEVLGFAPIFPDICYHLTHYKPAAADIPVASDNPAHYADAIRYNARTPLQGSLLPLTRLVWA